MEKPSIGLALKDIVLSAKAQLLSLINANTMARPQADKWSQNEILGHLIDSAANNHRRFVRAQTKNDMVFEGYDQAAWVKIQNYQERNWKELVELWAAYNLQLAHVMQNMDDEIRFRSISKHNLHEIASRTVPQDEATSLEYFMWDYVGHLEHHLGQILEGYEPRLGAYRNDFHKSS